MSRFAVFVLLSLVPAIAQAPAQKKTTRAKPRPAQPAKPPAPVPAPSFLVEQISVTGNKLYAAAAIVAVSGLKKGEPGGKERFDLARNQLLDTGAFQSVAYHYEATAGGMNYAVTFEVAEVEQVFPVRFEDLPAKPEELKAVLKKSDPLFGEKIPGTALVLKRYTKVLEEFLSGAKLSARVTSDGPGELFILFRPAEPPQNIAQVNFLGNKAVQTALLQNTIAGVAVGVPYNEQRFRLLLDNNIRPIYDARGRLRVAFPKITVEQAKDVKGYVVTVEVSEGDVYNLGDLTIEGGASRNELYKVAALKPDTVANFDDVNAALERMKTWLRSRGYLRPQARAERNIIDARKTVDLLVVIDPGPLFKFGKLTIVGLDLLGEPAVRKLWAVKEGQPFNADYPLYFLDRLRSDGYFDDLGKTKYELKVDEQRQVVDVILHFSGAPREQKKKREP
jgi:outer membrane protein assembly factor BamA